jgi:hypothetical protein
MTKCIVKPSTYGVMVGMMIKEFLPLFKSEDLCGKFVRHTSNLFLFF